MGKIDDMRRQREAAYAKQGGAAEVVADDASAAAEEARCSVCNKVRALRNGLVTSHQKGLGSFCPGSNKPPA